MFKKGKKKYEPVFKTEEPKEEIKVEPKISDEDLKQFTTTDNILAEKLQNKFTIIKAEFLDKSSPVRTFTFNASKGEVENFLKEGK